MRFAGPQMLWLLPTVLPLLTWFLWWAWRKKQSLIAQFVQSRLLVQLTVGVARSRQKIRLALIVVAVGCVLLALARPQWGYDLEKATQRGLDLVVAVDTSRSMLAEDVRPDRLSRAKLAALDLMRQAKSDRLGLVAFAGDAFLQCPLTLDEDAFRQSVNALEVGIIPQGGSLLTKAIETALTAFKNDGENYKILVLFSDGEDHDSGAAEAAEKAARAGLRIFTIGVGTPNGELLRITDENGVASYVKDAQGNAVKSRLNEELLQTIATKTSGFYLPLRGADAIETLYKEGLAPLPKAEFSARLVRRYHERFQWLLGLAILALLAEMLWPERRRVARSEAIVNAANAELRKAVSVLLLLTLPGAAFASTLSAKRLYESGKYKEAQQEYERLLEERQKKEMPNLADALTQDAMEKGEKTEQELTRSLEKAWLADPRLHFNAGASAYKAGDLESAQGHFAGAAIASDLELQQRAFYNLANTLYRLGEQNQDVNEKIKQWETAVGGYNAALNLKTNDVDAQYNRDFVKKKLEELKKQQPKQEGKQGQEKKDKQEKKQDEKKDASQPKEKKEQQREQDPQKQEQQRDSSKDEAAADQNKQPEQQPKQDKPDGQQKGEEKPGEKSQPDTPQVQPGKMTQQQAQQLLDSLKGEERALIFVPTKKAEPGNRVFKDW